MLLRQLISQGVLTISQSYPETEAREMVFACLEHILGTRRHTHIVEPEYAVDDDGVKKALDAFSRMACGEPLQYVTGQAFFYGRSFHVTSDTLIPRPETELLCRMAVDSMRAAGKQSPRILDMCTGSGCIAWTLALELPRSSVVAVDLSEGALAVASSQSFAEEKALTGASSPQFFKADVLRSVEESGLESLSARFDLILSNPPYVMDSEKSLMRSNVLDHEPHMALFVSDSDPLVFYRAVASWAQQLLSPDGVGIVEINEALGNETADVFRQAGFSRVSVEKDLYDKDRFVRFSRC